MKRRHNSIHWSDQHQALLAYCGSKAIRRCRRSGLIDIQDLMHEAWLLGLKNRAPDQLRGCGSIVVLQMYRAAADLITGRSRYKRDHAPATVCSLDESLDWPAPEDTERGPVAVDVSDELAAILACLDPRQRQILIWRYVDGLKLDDIARRIHRTRERARQLVNQALAEARKSACR